MDDHDPLQNPQRVLLPAFGRPGGDGQGVLEDQDDVGVGDDLGDVGEAPFDRRQLPCPCGVKLTEILAMIRCMAV